MKMRTWMLACGLSCACGPSEGGVDTDGTETDTESTGGDDAATMTTASTMSMTTAAMTMGGDETSSGGVADDDGVDDAPMTDDGATTGLPSDSSGDDVGTSPADSSGGGGSGTEGGSDTGSTAQDYPPCTEDADPVCPEPFDQCYDFIPGYDVCTQPCEDADDCPDAPDGDATPVCGGPMMNQCLLDCQDDAACPTGMECQSFGGGGMMFFRCVWPDE